MKIIVTYEGDKKHKSTEEMQFRSLQHLFNWIRDLGRDVKIKHDDELPILEICTTYHEEE